MPNIGDLFAGRFELHRELGRGGFATVFQAFDRVAQEAVALKVLHRDPRQDYEPDVRQRFEREVAIVARLDNPAIVQLLSHGEDDGYLWAAFELVAGRDLREVLEEVGTLPAGAVRAVLVQVLESLAEAHRNGLIHRDLKPENVRVFDGVNGPLTVKVLDFGIARSTDSGHPSLTKTGELVGTPRYMSPEQLKAQPLTPASDIYTLGLLGYELLAGRDGLPGGALGQQLDRMLPSFRYELPAAGPAEHELLATLVRFLEIDPKHRVSSADAALNLLGQPAFPSRPSLERSRNRWPWVALVSLLLAVGAIVTASKILGGKESTPAKTKDESTRVNPLAVAELSPQQATTTTGPNSRETTCAGRPRDGVWNLPSGNGGWAYVPDRFHAPTASVAMVLYNTEKTRPSELLDRVALRQIADEQNMLLFFPNDRSRNLVDNKPWLGEGERLWKELLETKSAFCLQAPPMFGFAVSKSATLGMEEVLIHAGDTLAGVVLAGGRHRLESEVGETKTQLGKLVKRQRGIDTLTGSAPLLDIAHGSDLDDRAVTSDGESFQTIRERREMLRELHRCSGDGEPLQLPEPWVCHRYECEVPLASCMVPVELVFEPVGGPVPGFLAEMAARHRNGGQACAGRPSDGIRRLDNGCIAYQPRKFVPTSASVVLALERTQSRTPEDLLERRGLRAFAEQANALVVVPVADPESAEGEPMIRKPWSADALARAQREMSQFMSDACVPAQAPIFGVSAHIAGAQGIELLAKLRPNLFWAIAFQGALYKKASPVREQTAKLSVSAGRPASIGILTGEIPLLDISLPKANELADQFEREDTESRHRNLRAAYRCEGSNEPTEVDGRTCVVQKGCSAPLELCTEDPLSNKFGEATIRFFDEARRWRAGRDQP